MGTSDLYPFSSGMAQQHQARQHIDMGICALRLGYSQVAIRFFHWSAMKT
jgi:hypothetical protein